MFLNICFHKYTLGRYRYIHVFEVANVNWLIDGTWSGIYHTSTTFNLEFCKPIYLTCSLYLNLKLIRHSSLKMLTETIHSAGKDPLFRSRTCTGEQHKFWNSFRNKSKNQKVVTSVWRTACKITQLKFIPNSFYAYYSSTVPWAKLSELVMGPLLCCNFSLVIRVHCHIEVEDTHYWIYDKQSWELLAFLRVTVTST